MLFHEEQEIKPKEVNGGVFPYPGDKVLLWICYECGKVYSAPTKVVHEFSVKNSPGDIIYGYELLPRGWVLEERFGLVAHKELFDKEYKAKEKKYTVVLCDACVEESK